MSSAGYDDSFKTVKEEVMKKIVLVFLALIFSGCARIGVTESAYVKPQANISAPKFRSIASGERKIMLSWYTVENAKGYEIFRGPCMKCNFQSIGRTGKNITKYVDKGSLLEHLGDNTTYFYRIAAVNRAGSIGQLSAVISSTTIKAPNPPDDMNASSNKARKIIITWMPSDNISVAGYYVYRYRSNNQFVRIAIVSGRLTSIYEDKGLKNGTKYYYAVSSYNMAGAVGKLSKTVSGVTKFPPLPPTLVETVSDMTKRVLITWHQSASNDIKQYQIQRAKGNGAFYNLAVVDSTITHFIDTNLTAGTIYRYKIKAIDMDNIAGNYSKIATAVTKQLPAPPADMSVTELSNGNIMISWKKSTTADVVSYIIWKRYWLVVTQEVGTSDGTTLIDSNVKKNTSYTYWIQSVGSSGQLSLHSASVTIKTSK